MHSFGSSAPLKDLLKKFGFTPDKVLEAAKNQIALQQGLEAKTRVGDTVSDLTSPTQRRVISMQLGIIGLGKYGRQHRAAPDRRDRARDASSSTSSEGPSRSSPAKA